MIITLKIMEPEVSDHAMIFLQDQELRLTRKRQFKFQNMVTTTEGFLTAVQTNWKQPFMGSVMFVLWKKLQRLQPIINDKVDMAMGRGGGEFRQT